MLLAIDTSTKAIGVALYDGVRVLSEANWFSNHHHTIELGPAIDVALTKAGVDRQELSVVGVAIGPGSFTGLRIGLALAKGLALSLQLKVIGVPTLDVLAVSQPTVGSRMAAVLEAGRRRLAVGWYNLENKFWKSTGPLENLTVDMLIAQLQKPIWVTGELGEQARSLITEKCPQAMLASPAQSVRRPAYLAELAWERYLKCEYDDPTTLKPIYLHQAEPIPG